MLFKYQLLAFICYATCKLGFVHAIAPDGRRNSSAVPGHVSNSYIIELDAGTSIPHRDNSIIHQEFQKRASTLIDYKVRYNFPDATYFFGVSIDVHNGSIVESLLSLPEVKNIYTNRVAQRPTPLKSKGTESAWKTSKRSAQSFDGTIPHITGTSDLLSALKMTGVDKLHDLGIKGKGVRIGIIDTGVDYRHPALGGGFGKGFKIAGGYDFVGDNYTGEFESPAPSPSLDPLAACIDGGHGTHVSGIIGAQDPERVGFGIIGVAPEATIYMYRIFGCEGTTTDDIILQAFVKAGQDGVHVISMSVGSEVPWETGSPFTSTLSALRQKGIAVIFSNGNDAMLGPYSASMPASDLSSFAVGSVTNTKFPTMYNAADSTGNTVEYARLIPISDPGEFNVFIVPVSETGFVCDLEASFLEANATFNDGSHVIALMLDNEWCASTAADLLRKTGIKSVWLYKDEVIDIDPFEIGYSRDFDIVKLRSLEAAKILAGIVAQGPNYKLTFQNQTVHDMDQPTGGTISYFSEIGPTIEMSLKPQLSAPGGYILSTWPLSGGIGYEILSGTSMAAPHVAGAYALIRSVHSSFSTTEILQMLQNTASPIPIYGSNMLSTSLQQGAGLLNVFEAMQYDSRIVPAELNLRDSATPAIQKITIKNKSHLPKAYTLGHQGAAQIDVAPSIFLEHPRFPWQLFTWTENNNPLYATAKFSTNSLNVRPLSSASFTVQIIPPAGLEPSKLPLYAGYITIQESNNSYVIPYAGVPYHRADYQTLDTTNLLDISITPLPPAAIPTVPLVYSEISVVRDNDVGTFGVNNTPTILLDIRQISQYVRADAVPVDTPFVPNTSGFDPKVKPATINPNISTHADMLGVQTYGLIAARLGPYITSLTGRFVHSFYGYGPLYLYWDWATLQSHNGSLYQVPNADYRVLLRALKWGSNYTDPKGYESWLSPIVRFNISKDEGPNPCLSTDPDDMFWCPGG